MKTLLISLIILLALSISSCAGTKPEHNDMESSNDRWFVAVMAAFAIAPNDQDKTFSSPDGKYILRAFDENTNTPAELTDYSLIVISDAETGKILYEGKKMYRNIDVTWDAQRGYAVISHGICGYSRDVDIIDIQGSVLLELPEERDIRALAAAETGKENVDDYFRYVIEFTGFSENQAEFRFAFSHPVFHDRISGQYSFDIEENVITGFQGTISEDIPETTAETITSEPGTASDNLKIASVLLTTELPVFLRFRVSSNHGLLQETLFRKLKIAI